MTFQPVLPMSGYTGWRFLARTIETQKDAFSESAAAVRATDYFRENIAKVRTAEDLVNDRRILSVALGAFGLEDDIDNKAFIRAVLEEGTIDDKALANRLADKRYEAFSRAFGFGDSGASTGRAGFAENIIDRYEAKTFEVAVGEQNGNFRAALNLSTGIADVLAQTSSPNTQWYAIMGNLPLRSVFETALGLPQGFGRIDLDQQLETFQSRSRATFGTDKVADFVEPKVQEKIIRLFLLRSELLSGAQYDAPSIALQLLRP
jgi:hypothetical protein